MLRAVLLSIFVFAWHSSALASNVEADDMKVKVQKEGGAVVIDLTVTVAATPQETWAVLVDFDHMPQFLSDMQSSKILERNGNQWKVAQKAKYARGIFSFAFESLRDVELKPFLSIRSHLISGTIKKLDSVTQLSPSGVGTVIVYHSESVSDMWVPPVVGTAILESEIRRQFQEMLAEIVRRKASAKAAGNIT